MKRCECELFVEKYFGLLPNTDQASVIVTDYGQLVNLLTMFRDEIKDNQLEFYVANKAFVAGRSKTSWNQFKKDNNL